MISSDLPEVLGMSDRIAVMRGGTHRRRCSRAAATRTTVMAAALGQAERRPRDEPLFPRTLRRRGARACCSLALAIFAPHFFEPQPLLSRLTSQMPALVAAIGMTLVIIARQIDISIGSQFACAA